MAYSLKIKTEARTELLKACSWYNSQKENLGTLFADEVDKGLVYISNNPEYYFKYTKSIRQYSLKRFPYNIYYIFKRDEVIVLAILHQKQNERTVLRKRKS